MSDTESSSKSTASSSKSTADPRPDGWLWAALICFLVLRVPMALSAAGQNDEEYFVGAGYTLWKEGIPRFPMCESTRDGQPVTSSSPYIRSLSTFLFIEPPGYYYLEWPCFALFGPSYATGRVPSLLAGILAIVIIWRVSRRVVSTTWVLGLSLVLFAVSRPLMFTAMIGRPDLACGVCGLMAVLVMNHWSRDPRARWLCLTGIACGAGLLLHPFAIVYCLQCGVWALIGRRAGTPLRRVLGAALLTGCCLGVFALWLPAILSHPREFAIQFSSNVIDDAGPGLGSRFVWPWASLWNHWDLMLEFNGPWQLGLLVVGILLACFTRPENVDSAERRQQLWLILSAGYLIAVCSGMHRTKGYWIYPIGMAYPLAVDGVIVVVDRLRRSLKGAERGSSATMAIVSVMLLALMLPGAGLRTVIGVARHPRDERYVAQWLANRVIAELPLDALFMADQGHLLDLYWSGRKALLLHPRQNYYWGDRLPEVDYLILTRLANDTDWKDAYETELIRREGSLSDDENFIEIHRVRRIKNVAPEGGDRVEQ